MDQPITAIAPLQFTPTPDSSLLAAYAYDPTRLLLVLRFKKKGEDTDDKSYGYPDITPEQFAEFQGAESQGKWFEANVRKQYPRGRFVYLRRDGTPQG